VNSQVMLLGSTDMMYNYIVDTFRSQEIDMDAVYKLFSNNLDVGVLRRVIEAFIDRTTVFDAEDGTKLLKMSKDLFLRYADKTLTQKGAYKSVFDLDFIFYLHSENDFDLNRIAKNYYNLTSKLPLDFEESIIPILNKTVTRFDTKFALQLLFLSPPLFKSYALTTFEKKDGLQDCVFDIELFESILKTEDVLFKHVIPKLYFDLTSKNVKVFDLNIILKLNETLDFKKQAHELFFMTCIFNISNNSVDIVRLLEVFDWPIEARILFNLTKHNGPIEDCENVEGYAKRLLIEGWKAEHDFVIEKFIFDEVVY
jgi:hypothetical protein